MQLSCTRARRALACALLASVLGACVGLPPTSNAVPARVSAAPERLPILDWQHIFKMPVGPRGLEPTDEFLALNGQRVRVVGYMVHEEAALPGQMKIAPLPVGLAEADDGPADDLPGNTVFVELPPRLATHVVPFRPGEWEVTGLLELGPKVGADGRVSYIRLHGDDAASGAPTVAAAQP